MDNLDIKILSRLLNNCREADRQIGIKLGISGSAVQARIQKMQDKKIIERFFIKVEPPILNYSVLYFVVSGEDINEILKQVSLVGQPYFVVPCIGGITVCSIIVQEDMEHKIELAKKLMNNVRVLSIFESGEYESNLNLTITDLEILEYLMNNPRQKIREIAQNTTLSTKTITRCIEKLQKSDGIEFTLIYDPQKIKDYIPHVILVSVDADFKNTLKNINEMFAESYMQTPFLAGDQIVLFMYADSIFNMDKITQMVHKVKNVKSVDLFIPKKFSFYDTWLEKSITSFKKSSKLHIQQIK